MRLDNYPKEIQNYIREANARRKESGSLDYDTCRRILEYAAKVSSDALFGIGYYCFAEHYLAMQDAEQTTQCLTECVKYFSSAGLYEYLTRVYNLMGVVSDSKNNRLVALSYYYTCLEYAERYQDTFAHAMADSNIGSILMRMKRYKDAKEHCYSAMDYFEKSEYASYRRKNYIQCVINCGFCHLLLEESEEALALWEKIQEILRHYPESKYSELCLLAFEVGCESVKGNQEKAIHLADRLEKALYEEENISELQKIIVTVADLLISMRSDQRIEKLVTLLDAKQIEKNPAVYLDLYPLKSKYLLQRNKVEEYVAYTKQYLALYQRYQEDCRTVTAGILDLQDKLNRVELEQKDIEAYNRNLESIALYDSLTGLANRTYLNEYLSQKFEQAYANQTLFGVELMDIDYFKEYNDTYGHLAGDVCIESVANVLKEIETESVFCARYGGDEFMVVYSNMTVQEVRNVVESIQNKVRDMDIFHESSECENKVTVSQGVFIKIPEEQNREWDFNSMADNVLYEAKKQGRNRYHIATDF